MRRRRQRQFSLICNIGAYDWKMAIAAFQELRKMGEPQWSEQ
jgi:hypothetical protein